MTEACRLWWRNCALDAGPEILAIDGMEDRIGPVPAEIAKIRELISSLELCHHKAESDVLDDTCGGLIQISEAKP